MGKHEAPSTARKNAPKHASPAAESKRFDFRMPEIKLPQLPDIKLPQVSKIKELPLWNKLRSIGKQAEFEDDEEFDDDEEPDEEIKIYESSRSARTPAVMPAEPAEGEASDASDPQEEMSEGHAAEPISVPAGEEADEADEADQPIRSRVSARSGQAPARRFPMLPKVDLSSLRQFFEKLASFGVSDEGNHPYMRSYAFNQPHVFFTGGVALLFFLLWLLPTRGAVRFALYLIPFAALAFYTFLDAVGEVLNKNLPGRNLLMLLASLGFLCLGQPHVSVFLLLIHRVFILIECYLFEKKEQMLEDLKTQVPDTAVFESEDGLERRSAAEFAVGDTLFVSAGEPVALDGVVLEGLSTLDTSALCGPGTQLDVGVGSRVFAGCNNISNPLRIRVTNTYTDSTVFRYVNRAEQAMDTHSSRAALLKRILSYLPLGLSVLGVLLGLIMSLATGEWSVWLSRGFLLISLAGCGDALLSARMAFCTGVLDALKQGISYQSADVVDRFSTSDMMIFSKTGSITEGQFTVVGVYPVDYEEKDLLTIAALAECQSTHPIADALRDACGIGIHHRSDITLLEETPGRGIHTLFGGRNVYVGNSTLLIDHNIVFDVPAHKGTVIHIAVDNKYAGCIVLNDKIRDGAFDAIEELRLRGIRAAVMLTGDVRSMARPIASSLGFDMVKCELSNESKLDALNYLRDSKGNNAAISYVSCKEEDLEILKQADISVGFHALTEYRFIQEASVLIMGSSIFTIPQALYLAKRISLAALLDICIMLGVELLMLILGLAGAVSAWFALLMILLCRVGTLVYSIYFK